MRSRRRRGMLVIDQVPATWFPRHRDPPPGVAREGSRTPGAFAFFGVHLRARSGLAQMRSITRSEVALAPGETETSGRRAASQRRRIARSWRVVRSNAASTSISRDDRAGSSTRKNSPPPKTSTSRNTFHKQLSAFSSQLINWLWRRRFPSSLLYGRRCAARSSASAVASPPNSLRAFLHLPSS